MGIVRRLQSGWLTVLMTWLASGGAYAATPQVPGPSSPGEAWNLDIAGTAAISPGIGAATTGLGLSGAVTIVRSAESGDFDHRCVGLTAMFTGLWSRSEPPAANARERSVLFGPRWDAGDLDGTAFVRVLAGLRRSGGANPPAGTIGIGAGVGMAVGAVLLDVNWVVSPWSDEASHRLTVGIGYIWSRRLSR